MLVHSWIPSYAGRRDGRIAIWGLQNKLGMIGVTYVVPAMQEAEVGQKWEILSKK
jgi:hypothetical protein